MGKLHGGRVNIALALCINMLAACNQPGLKSWFKGDTESFTFNGIEKERYLQRLKQTFVILSFNCGEKFVL